MTGDQLAMMPSDGHEEQAMTKLAFVDTETTGLDPDRHEIWEVALIVREDGARSELTWQLPIRDLGTAEARALTVSRFWERYQADSFLWCDRQEADKLLHAFVQEFSKITHGAHLVGAVPDFDSQRLSKLLRANGGCPGWYYHLICIENLAVGWVQGRAAALKAEHKVEIESMSLPWNSTELSRAVGIDPERFDRHTALGDARWAEAIYDAVMGIRDNQDDG